MKKYFKSLILILFFFLITIEASPGMSLFQNDFEKRWEELSRDVKQLNEYTLTHSIELRNVRVGDKDLTGAVFIGATFAGVEWEGTIIENVKFTKTVFKDCRFVGSLHWNSTFTDVFFENCTFQSAEFGGSTMVDVRFFNCKITDSRFEEMQGSELIFDGSVLEERTSFAESSIPMAFRRCTLDGVGLSGMKLPHKMTVEDSLLDEVDFGRGHFSEIVLRRVKQGEGAVKFNKTIASTITLANVNMNAVGFIGTKAECLRVINSRMRALGVKGGGINKIYLRDSEVGYLNVSESMMPHIEVANSQLYEPHLYEGFIGHFSVINSTIENAEAFDFKADTVVWDNVTLDGKIDLTNAQVKDFRPTRLKRGSKLQLITTGSNMRFN